MPSTVAAGQRTMLVIVPVEGLGWYRLTAVWIYAQQPCRKSLHLMSLPKCWGMGGNEEMRIAECEMRNPQFAIDWSGGSSRTADERLPFRD
jgi:hypothetical protein